MSILIYLQLATMLCCLTAVGHSSNEDNSLSIVDSSHVNYPFILKAVNKPECFEVL